MQQEHQSASAVLIFAAPMSAWLAREGERGYRAIALQIGMMTDTLYLAAEALHLTYTASGGFPPASIDAALGLDGVTHAAFFSFVIGGPRP
jgi:nitroreductase